MRILLILFLTVLTACSFRSTSTTKPPTVEDLLEFAGDAGAAACFGLTLTEKPAIYDQMKKATIQARAVLLSEHPDLNAMQAILTAPHLPEKSAVLAYVVFQTIRRQLSNDTNLLTHRTTPFLMVQEFLLGCEDEQARVPGHPL